MFASNQTACQRKKPSPDENRCSSPVKPTTTPHTRLARALRSSLKITSASFARHFVLDGPRACLKVSGYEVIGRARGDLGAKFAANVRVYIWDALSSVTFFPFRNPRPRPWSMFKAPGLLLVSRKITLMFFFVCFSFSFQSQTPFHSVLGWPLGMSALGSYKLMLGQEHCSWEPKIMFPFLRIWPF